MPEPSQNQDTASAGCCPPASFGCLLSLILFPFCIIPSMWIAFAMGSMGCALPKRCSDAEQNGKAIAPMVILFGGGFGVPIASGILLTKALQRKDKY